MAPFRVRAKKQMRPQSSPSLSPYFVVAHSEERVRGAHSLLVHELVFGYQEPAGTPLLLLVIVEVVQQLADLPSRRVNSQPRRRLRNSSSHHPQFFADENSRQAV